MINYNRYPLSRNRMRVFDAATAEKDEVANAVNNEINTVTEVGNGETVSASTGIILEDNHNNDESN